MDPGKEAIGICWCVNRGTLRVAQWRTHRGCHVHAGWETDLLLLALYTGILSPTEQSVSEVLMQNRAV